MCCAFQCELIITHQPVGRRELDGLSKLQALSLLDDVRKRFVVSPKGKAKTHNLVRDAAAADKKD
jgi:hypothetical protein